MSFFYNSTELGIFKKLNTPAKIQDFLNILKFNFEKKGETCRSPRFVLKHKTAHCMEGAMLASAILEFHGYKPWVLDLRANAQDFDHVVAVFKLGDFFGAISKTNHAVLRYREPIYKNIRELAMSYFHEYFDQKGNKNLREYSELLNLEYFDKHPHPSPLPKGEGKGLGSGLPLLFAKEEVGRSSSWRTSEENLFFIPKHLDTIKHFKILSKVQIKNLRKADKIEIQAGEIVEFKK
jgi:hypothetical protein